MSLYTEYFFVISYLPAVIKDLQIIFDTIKIRQYFLPLLMVNYSFLGKGWSFWPPSDEKGRLNIISDIRRPSHDIISLLLFQKGDDPLHPDFGLAPELFIPMSSYDPQYWVYNVEKEITDWIPNISQLLVRVSGYEGSGNTLYSQIEYTPISEPGNYTLTFPFWQYQGALWDNSKESLPAFLSTILLNERSLFPSQMR